MAPLKKERNYVIDFWKLWGCILVMLCHFGLNMFGGTTPFDYMSQMNLNEADFFYPRGVITLGFFTFTTGYWLMQAYQSQKRKGLFGKGHDMELIYRYAAKNYVAYFPIIFVSVTISYIALNILNGSSLQIWLSTLAWNIWEFLGLGQANIINVTGDGFLTWFTGGPGSLVNPGVYQFVNVTWYMSQIICFGYIFYALLVKCETITVFVILPIIFTSGMWGSNNLFSGQLVGLNQLFGSSFSHIWGPAVAGMWAWYLVDALQKANLSKRTTNIMGWCSMLLTVSFIYCNIFGYYGGMVNNDTHFILVAFFALVNRDWFTRGFNNLLGKLPFVNQLQIFGLGIFVSHWQIMFVFMRFYLPTHDAKSTTIYFMLAMAAMGFIWVLVNKVIITPMSKKLTKLFRLHTPVGEMLTPQEPAAQ